MSMRYSLYFLYFFKTINTHALLVSGNNEKQLLILQLNYANLN